MLWVPTRGLGIQATEGGSATAGSTAPYTLRGYVGARVRSPPTHGKVQQEHLSLSGGLKGEVTVAAEIRANVAVSVGT